LQFSSVLGGWSWQPILFGITPAKILLLLLTFIAGCALAGLARLVIFRFHSLGRVKPITERYWRNGILFALRKALTGIFIFSGAFFAAAPILPHIGFAVGGFPTFAVAAKIAGLGYFAAALGFCLRIVRLVQHWLIGFTQRSPSRWYYGAFPVLGKALQYNVLLCAALATIYILRLPDFAEKACYHRRRYRQYSALDPNGFGGGIDDDVKTGGSPVRRVQASENRDPRPDDPQVAGVYHHRRWHRGYAAEFSTGPPNWDRPAGIGWGGGRHCGTGCAEIAFDHHCRPPGRDNPTDTH
jgi:hypothetical protein